MKLKLTQKLKASLLLVLVVFFMFPVATVGAASVILKTEVVDNIDMCPNIPGMQPTMPEGMVLDADGNCYTPTPPPTMIDLCSNLPGIQSVVPINYYRANDGRCFPRSVSPEQPPDICSNLDGIQAEMPEGYYLDAETNQCLPTDLGGEDGGDGKDKDVCQNIPGIQFTTPDGMNNDNGYCYTPTGSGSGTGEDRPPLKNVPDFLRPLMHGLVDLVPESVQQFFRDLPQEVTDGIPIYIFVLVLILVLLPILQSIREAAYARRLAALYEREKNIADEKNNFMSLTAHYLHTPIAIMKDSLGLAVHANGAIAQEAATLTETLDGINSNITNSLDAAGANLEESIPPVAEVKPTPFWRSIYFWLPIIISLVLTLLINFFLGVVGDKEIAWTNSLWQILLIVIFVVVVYLAVRNFQIQKSIKQKSDELIARETAIDKERNDFISRQAGILSEDLAILYEGSSLIAEPGARRLYDNGLGRLSDVYNKFALMQQIEAGASSRGATEFNLRDAVDRAIASKRSEIDAKRINIKNDASDINITQNAALFNFVITSLIDNAIKFNREGGGIYIGSGSSPDTLTLRVSDNGHGIAPEKIGQLFKPFSRTESAIDFSYEGLGLSLFFDRLILNYTGGNISAIPRQAGGTDVVIESPLDITTKALNPAPSA